MTFSFNDDDEFYSDIVADLEILREDVVLELQAINQYQDDIESLNNESAINLLEKIIDDKKEHVAKLFRVINELDPTQAEKFINERIQ